MSTIEFNQGLSQGEKPVLTSQIISRDDMFRCGVVVEQEDDGSFSVYVPRLPGVASQGDTAQEALANIEEALAGALASYIHDGVEIPWEGESDHGDEVMVGARKFWITVNV
jgi:predicted RNase H-like HicB family nuclease